MTEIIRPKIILTSVATVSNGKQLEITAEINETTIDVANFIADEQDNSIWLELSSHGKIIQIPISIIARAIDIAATEVKSETWYEKMYTPCGKKPNPRFNTDRLRRPR